MRCTDRMAILIVNMDTVPTVHTQSGQRMVRLLRSIFGSQPPAPRSAGSPQSFQIEAKFFKNAAEIRHPSPCRAELYTPDFT
jgi:hypothetical protein